MSYNIKFSVTHIILDTGSIRGYLSICEQGKTQQLDKYLYTKEVKSLGYTSDKLRTEQYNLAPNIRGSVVLFKRFAKSNTVDKVSSFLSSNSSEIHNLRINPRNTYSFDKQTMKGSNQTR